MTLSDELERLIEAFHNAMPQGQGENGDGGAAGKALCQFVYDRSDDIAAALRQPDQRHPSVIACEDYFRHLQPVPDAAAAIQSLTAERDGWNNMVRDMSLEIGLRLGERDAALARVAELEVGLIFIAPAMPVLRDMLKRAKMPKGANKAAEMIECIRALLEGSKP